MTVSTKRTFQNFLYMGFIKHLITDVHVLLIFCILSSWERFDDRRQVAKANDRELTVDTRDSTYV